MRCICLITGALLLLCACEKAKFDPPGKVHIYMLKDYSADFPSRKILDSTVTLQDEPLIAYKELLSYDPGEHAFRVKQELIDNLRRIDSDVHGRPFAVVAGQEIIYTGYFWPAYFSSLCDWVYIDPILGCMGGTLKVELGYPWMLDEWDIPDRRNDPRILDIFRRDYKLEE